MRKKELMNQMTVKHKNAEKNLIVTLDKKRQEDKDKVVELMAKVAETKEKLANTVALNRKSESYI